MKGVINTALILSICLPLAGCATMLKTSFQKIPIYTNPGPANVFVDEVKKGETPCRVDFERNKVHVVTIKKEGYKTVQFILKKQFSSATIPSAILGGALGLGVDIESGAGYNLIPGKVNINMTPGNESDVIFEDFSSKEK